MEQVPAAHAGSDEKPITRQPYTPPVVTDLGAFANPAITGSGICSDEQSGGDINGCICACPCPCICVP